MSDFFHYVPTVPTVTCERQEWAERNIPGIIEQEGAHVLAGDGQVAVHLDDASTVLVMGGNQSGKSVCSIVELLILTTGHIPISLRKTYPRGKLLCNKLPLIEGRLLCGTVEVLHNTIIPAFQRWTPREALVSGSWKCSWSGLERALSLVACNGVKIRIDCKTYRQQSQSHAGPHREFLFFDEIPPVDIYRENMARLSTAADPKVLIAATPVYGMASWMYQDLVVRALEEKSKVSLHNLSVLSNPRTNLEQLEEIIKLYNGSDQVKMRMFGSFIALSGFVYGDVFRRREHVIPPFEITSEHMVVRGLDPHWEKPACCVEAALDNAGKIYIIGTYWKKGTIEAIKRDLAARVEGYRMGPTVVDASLGIKSSIGGTTTVIDDMRSGANAIRSMRTSDKAIGSIERDIRRIRKYLTNGDLYIFDTPENQLLIVAMETLERNMRDAWKGKDSFREQNLDAHACLRYIFQLPLSFFEEREQNVYSYLPGRQRGWAY